MVDVIFFSTIIDLVSSDFPSVANQWSAGSHGPYSIFKKIRRIHQLHGYDSTGLLIAVLLELSNFCKGKATMHCPIRGQSIEGFYILPHAGWCIGLGRWFGKFGGRGQGLYRSIGKGSIISV